MKFDSDLYLKWLTPDNPTLRGIKASLIKECVFVAKNKDGHIVGLTVFRKSDFDQGFMPRLKVRLQSDDFKALKFEFYVPISFVKSARDGIAEIASIQISFTSTDFLHIQVQNEAFVVRSRLRVLCVDDSPTMLKILKKTFTDIGWIDTVAQISDPKIAVDEILRIKPDLITLDIQMPQVTGIDIIKSFLSVEYYPVLVVSSLSLNDTSLVFEALNAGAFDFIQKPKSEEMGVFREEIVNKTLMAVAGRAVGSSLHQKQIHQDLSTEKRAKNNDGLYFSSRHLWCMGSSTGGTQALTQIFTALPEHIPPTFVVQHMPAEFLRAFVKSLDRLCPFKVKEAKDGEPVLMDHVYVAPGGFQMGVVVLHNVLTIVLNDEDSVHRFKPSVSYFFNSLAKVKGYSIIAGLFTGMGRDGVDGLLALKNQGAVTFAQDESSSVVYGMPRVAIESGAATMAVHLDDIAGTLMRLSQTSHVNKKIG